MAKSVIIQCGILQSQGSSSDYFWPVLSAQTLEFSFPDIEDITFSLLFTSKIAVDYFFKENRHFKIFANKNLKNIISVGAATANYLTRNFQSLIENTPIYYPKNEGLEGALDEFPILENSKLFLITSEGGKTSSILMKDKFAKINSQIEVISAYRLLPFKSDFLAQIFSHDAKLSNTYYIFSCQSGFVLESTLLQLCDFFCVDSFHKLPEFILFSVKKASTIEKAKTIGLKKISSRFILN